MGHSDCTRGSWLEATTMNQEVQNTSVFTNNHNSSKPHLAFKVSGEEFTEASTWLQTVRQHSPTCSSTMPLVLSATLKYATQRSPYQQGHPALPHGQGSTLATSWLTDMFQITPVDEFLSVSTAIPSLFQEVEREAATHSCIS
jgi:hypothetical protein